MMFLVLFVLCSCSVRVLVFVHDCVLVRFVFLSLFVIVSVVLFGSVLFSVAVLVLA